MKTTFLYHAQASVLGGFITIPEQKIVETVGGVSLPIAGGHQFSQVNGYCFDKPEITIASATAQVSGSQDGNGVYNTIIETTINGLIIADYKTHEKVITADKIELSMTTAHSADDTEATILITGRFNNLIIKGEPVNMVLDKCLNDAPTFAQFDKKYGNKPNVSKSKRPGTMRCSLIEKITHSHANPATDQQSLYVPDFGTIYLGEVYLADSTRRVSMMRLQLGSPVVGAMSLGDGQGNGTPFP